MPKRKFTIMLLLFAALWITITTHAQENLLQNPGFNGSGSYVDQRPAGATQPFAIAPGWNGWQTTSPRTTSWMNLEPIAFPHTGDSKREGDASQNVGRGDSTFTAAVYQTIGGVAEGNTYRFSVWVFQDSETGSGSQTRVGIGSNVGGNPFGSPITWSSWSGAIDSWQQLTVEATVPAGSITVFIYSTQSVPKPQNQNYYDEATLVLLNADGTVNVGAGQEATANPDGTVMPPAPPTSTPQVFAPFVNAQGAQDSGRIVHTVTSGDTLAAIAVAYGVPSAEILELNGLTREEARFLRIGQQLIISEGNPDAAEEPADETEEPTDETNETAQSSGFASPTPRTAAQASTDIPTPTVVPTEATEEPTPDVSPTPTEIPATPTDAPTAPVEQGSDSDPLAIDTGVCTLMFDDLNNNNIQEAGEDLLEGGQITLSDDTDTVLQEYITDGSEPFCFEELSAGNYTMRGTAPDGYGLNTSLRAVNVQAGQVFTVSYAAVEGLEVAVIPTVNTSAVDDEPIIEETPDPLGNIRNIAGILVLGIAGAVLIGGVVVGFIVGRNR
ncbi:MAG: LysM peptidoglycan-binding domain-containing protein [Phototrophicaceae bacterium]